MLEVGTMNLVYFLIGAVAGYLARLWQLAFYEVRLDPTVVSRFYNNMRRRGPWKFTLSET